MRAFRKCHLFVLLILGTLFHCICWFEFWPLILLHLDLLYVFVLHRKPTNYFFRSHKRKIPKCSALGFSSVFSLWRHFFLCKACFKKTNIFLPRLPSCQIWWLDEESSHCMCLDVYPQMWFMWLFIKMNDALPQKYMNSGSLTTYNIHPAVYWCRHYLGDMLIREIKFWLCRKWAGKY